MPKPQSPLNPLLKNKPKSGFTMIEVVLVLAIGGLIFMGIFIALPNAQLNQRNSNRRADYSRLATNISNYTSDNNGRLPSPTVIQSHPEWLTNKTPAEDPDGATYTLTGVDCSNVTAASCTPPDTLAQAQVIVYIGAECDTATGKPKKANSSRTFAIYGYMENGTAAGDTYCHQSNG